ncbi:MAG: hypothetical protein AB7K52_12220 [Phycisphaerales bacterium]
MMHTLAQNIPWRPFLDPMPMAWFDHWYLFLIPLSLLVAVSYKAVRVQDWTAGAYIRQVAIMTVQIIVGMIALALASYLLVEVFVPWARG